MSFNKQILLFISAVMLVLLVGTFLLNLSNTKHFLQNQLQAQAQDTSTSLALSLSSVADLDNPASMQAMINAVFDRGYYARIALVDREGALLYSRVHTQMAVGIPHWFVQTIDIEAPQAQALVQNGWMPIGTLTVQAHPGYAYAELWQAAKNLLLWFGLAAWLALGLAFVAVRAMLRPLHKVAQQAEAIVNKEYVFQHKIPRTAEFNRVVVAMNKMVTKLREVFEREAQMAEKLQRMAYQDAVTGLSNRHHFDMLFDAVLDPKTGDAQGALCLLRVEGLKTLNEEYGYQVGDRFMTLLAQRFSQVFRTEEAIFARLNGVEMIAVLPSINAHTRMAQAEHFRLQAEQICAEMNLASAPVALVIALMNFQPGEQRAHLLSRLEFSLAQAARRPERQVVMCDTPMVRQLNDEAWQALVVQAFNESRFCLYKQASHNENGTLHDIEVLARMQDLDGTLRAASYFMPAMEQFGKVLALDSLVLKMVLNHLQQRADGPMLAVNLSHSLLHDSEAVTQLFALIAQAKGLALAFEFSEHWVAGDLALSTPILAGLREMGFKTGIDHFGSRFINMQYLQDLRPDYIKLDGAFSRRIETDTQTQSYVKSLVEMAQSLDIEVIAMAVENADQLRAFSAVGVKFYQGYHFGAPTPL
ncbi:MAG: EAL domain-containing protein [Thiomicrospira sp.]